MPYKVFFVEDEIVTREGIRDNVDWKGNGFEFCGDASDGEMALPLLQAARPDVLITDIKMPFMDGLQLCRIVRERMPGIKIVILSGHDEFEYAQQAINLGVTEYLLKPVTPQNIHHVLQRVAVQLAAEGKERENLQSLHAHVRENQAALRERLLLKLTVGAVSPSEAIEQGQLLGLDLVARCYLVVIVKTELADRSEQFNYEEYQQVQQLVTEVVARNPDIYLLRKGWDELVLILKGRSLERLEEERDLVIERIKREAGRTRYQLAVGAGTPKERIADIYQSFTEAWVHTQNAVNRTEPAANLQVEKAELIKIDKTAVENFLRCAVKEDFGTFFDAFIEPLGEVAVRSHLIKSYIFMDIVVVSAKFVSELGGDVEGLIPTFHEIEAALTNIKSMEQLREEACKLLGSILVFRDDQNNSPHWRLIQKARAYIDQHFMDADLSLNVVAAHANLSPSHFSMVFRQQTNQTFKEYVTEIRIRTAKELLRMTSLNATEISYQVGYKDPHYFSYVFGKHTGISPKEFRLPEKVNRRVGASGMGGRPDEVDENDG